jgi:hypothetical protein
MSFVKDATDSYNAPPVFQLEARTMPAPDRRKEVGEEIDVRMNPRFVERQRNLEQQPGIILIVFDPISEFLGAKIDSHSNTAIRAVLGQLMDMLDRRNIAALGVSHLPKMKTGAVQTASIGSSGSRHARAQACWSPRRRKR